MNAPLEVGDAYLVVVAAVLTWVISFVALIAYRAYVRKLIARISRLDVTAASAPDTHESSSRSQARSRVSWTRIVPREDGALYDRAMLRRREIARSYTLAAAVYAVIASLMLLVAMGTLSVMTLVINTWVQAWPLMLTLDVLDGGAARWRRIGRYCLVLLALGGLTMVIGVMRGRLEIAPWPLMAIAGVGLFEWALRMTLPTVAILPTLHRSVREVAPIVLIVMLSALVALRLAMPRSAPAFWQYALATDAIGFTGWPRIALFITLMTVVAVGLGMLVAFVVRWLYRSGHVSKPSLSVEAIWAFFTLELCLHLFIKWGAWGLSGLLPWAVFRTIVAIRLRAARREAMSSRPPRLLFLRRFKPSDRRAHDRFFAILDSVWPYVGTTCLIAGPDLARRTVDPDLFLEFMTGGLRDQFRATDDALGNPLHAESARRRRAVPRESGVLFRSDLADRGREVAGCQRSRIDGPERLHRP